MILDLQVCAFSVQIQMMQYFGAALLRKVRPQLCLIYKVLGVACVWQDLRLKGETFSLEFLVLVGTGHLWARRVSMVWPLRVCAGHLGSTRAQPSLRPPALGSRAGGALRALGAGLQGSCLWLPARTRSREREQGALSTQAALRVLPSREAFLQAAGVGIPVNYTIRRWWQWTGGESSPWSRRGVGACCVAAGLLPIPGTLGSCTSLMHPTTEWGEEAAAQRLQGLGGSGEGHIKNDGMIPQTAGLCPQ